PRGRAYRQPRLRVRRGGHEHARRVERGGHEDRHGHALVSSCPVRAAHGADARRASADGKHDPRAACGRPRLTRRRNAIMLKSYAAIALRHLTNHGLYSAINIVGLAVGIACFILIGLFVTHELGFDKHWANADRIYRVSRDYAPV